MTKTDKQILEELDELYHKKFWNEGDLKNFILAATAKTRVAMVEEVRMIMWNGATRDEVHRRLDELKAEHGEEK